MRSDLLQRREATVLLRGLRAANRNARDCGRMHCHFTGPFFLLTAVDFHAQLTRTGKYQLLEYPEKRRCKSGAAQK